MFISLEWDIFLKMRFLLSNIMSQMAHIHNKNKANWFQILAADSFKCKAPTGWQHICAHFSKKLVHLREFS